MFCDIMLVMAFEQEPVPKIPCIRELSVGARQLLGFGEFILRAADLKFVHATYE